MKIYSGRDGGELLAVFGAGRYHGMGSDVCGAGDMNGNGLPEFVVSARGEGVVGIPHCGRVYVGGFSPLMTSSSETVSASQGGVIVLSLDFAPADAGATYQLLGSERGKGPDVFMGLTIPLTIGGWLWNALLTNPPPAFSSTRGRLDADGDAAIFITLPPGALTQWVGATAHFASVLIDPLQRVPVKTSVAVPLMINP